MEISAYGMGLEKLRQEISSENISRMNQAMPVGSATPPRNMSVISIEGMNFNSFIKNGSIYDLGKLEQIRLLDGKTKLVHEPKNPLADNQGYVEYPDTDHLVEMVNMLKAARAYEANVKAFNAAKVMQEEALKMGK